MKRVSRLKGAVAVRHISLGVVTYSQAWCTAKFRRGVRQFSGVVYTFQAWCTIFKRGVHFSGVVYTFQAWCTIFRRGVRQFSGVVFGNFQAWCTAILRRGVRQCTVAESHPSCLKGKD